MICSHFSLLGVVEAFFTQYRRAYSDSWFVFGPMEFLHCDCETRMQLVCLWPCPLLCQPAGRYQRQGSGGIGEKSFGKTGDAQMLAGFTLLKAMIRHKNRSDQGWPAFLEILS